MNYSYSVNTGFIQKATILIVLAFMLAGLSLYVTGHAAPAMVCLAVPVILILTSFPRLTVYLYVFCIFVYVLLMTVPRLLLIDVVGMILVASFAVDLLLNYRVTLRLPVIYKYFVALMLALIIAAIFGHYRIYAATPLIRVLLQMIIVITLYNVIGFKHVRRLTEFYFWLAAGHSLYNVIIFVATGGIFRVFGTAYVFFDDLAMLAAPIGLAYFLWSESRGKSWLYGLGTILILFGLIATQSRGPFITFLWVALFLIIFSAYKAWKGDVVRVRRRVKLSLQGAILSALLIFVFFGLFKDAAERFLQLSELAEGTVWLRLALWQASIVAFLENPITGIGPGNFRFVESILPILRFDAALPYVAGFSAHNLVLHYLAETGLIGTVAIVALFFRNLVSSIRATGYLGKVALSPTLVAMLGVGVTLFGSIFYLDGWMWSVNAYVAPFFIALTAKLAVGIGNA